MKLIASNQKCFLILLTIQPKLGGMYDLYFTQDKEQVIVGILGRSFLDPAVWNSLFLIGLLFEDIHILAKYILKQSRASV